MLNFEKYVTIRKAVMLIALDNGCINRSSDEDRVLTKVGAVLAVKFKPEQLLEVEGYLSTLEKEDIYELCCGEETDPQNPLEALVASVLESAFNSLL